MKREVITLIEAMPNDWLFSAHDFLHIGTRKSISALLFRLNRVGFINRVRRGVYQIKGV